MAIPIAPKPIRDICNKFGANRPKSIMRKVALGHNDYYPTDLLLELCTLGSLAPADASEQLRQVGHWVLDQVREWPIAEDRGVEFDQSKGLEKG